MGFDFGPAPELKKLSISKFRGVDFANNATQVASNRSPNAENIVSDLAGKPVKRTGYETIANFGAQINGIFRLATEDTEKFIVHAGTKLYEWTRVDGEFAANGTEIYADMNNQRSVALDLMQPSDYAAELRKCQRYLQIYNVPLWFYTPHEWYAETIFDLEEEMRIIPSFSFEGNVEIVRDNGDLDILVSTVTQFSGNTTKPLLRLTIDNGKAVMGHSYLLRELKLIFSAEL